MTPKRLIYLTAILIMGLVLVSCEQMKIADINKDPGNYMNKEVGIAGRVTQSFGALGKGIYQIDDGTGHLWVWSETHGVPSTGAYVAVKGHVIPTITFLGQNYTSVMREAERRDVQPSH